MTLSSSIYVLSTRKTYFPQLVSDVFAWQLNHCSHPFYPPSALAFWEIASVLHIMQVCTDLWQQCLFLETEVHHSQSPRIKWIFSRETMIIGQHSWLSSQVIQPKFCFGVVHFCLDLSSVFVCLSEQKWWPVFTKDLNGLSLWQGMRTHLWTVPAHSCPIGCELWEVITGSTRLDQESLSSALFHGSTRESKY